MHNFVTYNTYSSNCSCVLVEPVTWGLMSLEGLLTELLVATILHGVGLESVRVAVEVMVLGEEVRDWIHGESDEQSGVDHNLLVWYLGTRHEHQIL